MPSHFFPCFTILSLSNVSETAIIDILFEQIFLYRSVIDQEYGAAINVSETVINLWSGNINSDTDTNGDPVILDPACYCKQSTLFLALRFQNHGYWLQKNEFT
jgi:hypothetical protein